MRARGEQRTQTCRFPGERVLSSLVFEETTMHVEIVVDEQLKHREDLIKVMKAAADSLASRDTEQDSEARALWRLWSDQNGEIWISLMLQDLEFSNTHQFSPSQLIPRDLREIRM